MAQGLPKTKGPYRTGKVVGRQNPLPAKPKAVKSRAPKVPKCK